MSLCVVGRLITAGQMIYLRKCRETELRQSFVWSSDRDHARWMTAEVAVRVMRAAREFCSAPTFALDKRGQIISIGPRILSKAEQRDAKQALRASTRAYKNVGKTLQIAAEWHKGRYLTTLKPRRRNTEHVSTTRASEAEVVADMVTSTVARLLRLPKRPRKIYVGKIYVVSNIKRRARK
jgi:hypothetical protein